MRIPKLFVRLTLLLVFLNCTAWGQPAVANKSVLNIEYWQTSQGTPVYFVRTPELPMVDIRVVFNAGSAYDQDQWGIAQLTTLMLNQGTQKNNADQIANTFDGLGAQYNYDTTRDYTAISLRSLSDPKYLAPALAMFNEVLTQANFPEDAFSRSKQQTLSAIQQAHEDPVSTGTNAFYENLYPGNPYAHPVLGTGQTVNAMTRNQLDDFYHRYFVSSNAKIILVGDLDRSAAEKWAEQLMSALPKGNPVTQLTMVQNSPGGEHSITFPSQQTTIITGQLGINRQNPQYFPLTVGNYILGVMPLNSLLFEQVRNQRGLAYDVSSSFLLLSARGPFVIVLQTRAAEKNQALNISQQVLKQFLASGPNGQQLQQAKQNIINHFPLNLSTNEEIASTLLQMAINQRPLNYLDTYREHINAVTADQIKQAFQATINPNTLLTVMVGPQSS